MKRALFIVIVAVLLGCQSNPHWETATALTSEWRYLLAPTPPETWNNTDFNDENWGIDLVNIKGFDSTRIAGNRLFIRSNFNVENTDEVSQGFIQTGYKVAFVAYLNGKEIARRDVGEISSAITPNIGSDAIGIRKYWQPASYFVDQTTMATAIQQGENTIAIEVLNPDFNQVSLSKTSFTIELKTSSNRYGNDEDRPTASFDPQTTFTSSNLPIVVINTHHQSILDEPKITVDMGIIYNGEGQQNHLSDPLNHYEGQIGIEIRGYTSQTFSKKQYSFKILDTAGLRVDVSLLGMPAENDWILHAPYADLSMMRNVLVYKLWGDMGHYAARSQYCELVINNNYQGVYLLMEKIKQDSGRLNIAELTPNDTTGEALTGGYVIKADRGNDEHWDSPYPKRYDEAMPAILKYHDPKASKLKPVQKQYIQEYVTRFEAALYSDYYKDPETGYRNFINTASFIDYLILNEVTKNGDAYRLSTYMYKDRGGPLNMGPVWDYNFALGVSQHIDNIDEFEGQTPEGWIYNSMWYIPFWWNKFSQDTTFRNQLYTRWDELRAGALHNDAITAFIDEQAALLQDAQARNYMKWPLPEDGTFWPNYYAGPTHADNVTYLKEWMVNRLNWMDEHWFEEEEKITRYMLKIHKDTVWSVSIQKKAAENNIPYDKQLRLDAKWMLSQDEKKATENDSLSTQ